MVEKVNCDNWVTDDIETNCHKVTWILKYYLHINIQDSLQRMEHFSELASEWTASVFLYF